MDLNPGLTHFLLWNIFIVKVHSVQPFVTWVFKKNVFNKNPNLTCHLLTLCIALQSLVLKIKRSIVLVKCYVKLSAEPDFRKKCINFSPIYKLRLHNQDHGKFILATVHEHERSQALFSRYPYSDLFSAQPQYCLKIKIHGSYPLNTCDRFSARLRHQRRNRVTPPRPHSNVYL